MENKTLEKKFAEIGANLDVGPFASSRWVRRVPNSVVVDIRKGQFDIRFEGDVEIKVVDVQPKDRHLLLHVNAGGTKSKYLCGHDERDWFVAAIPERLGVKDVKSAKAALKPGVVHQEESRKGVKTKNKDRRKNKGSIRQGEWFFTPAPKVNPLALLILKDEPMVRAGAAGRMGKPHYAQECYRIGGETVYVCNQHPQGVSESTYRTLMKDAAKQKWFWQVMRRNPTVYVRGKITHPDHATIVLTGWHRVTMNTENQAASMKNVAFLD